MSFWTYERLETLRSLAPTHSAGKIGEALGCTRNAVIGKASRAGIPLTKLDGPGVTFLGKALPKAIQSPRRRVQAAASPVHLAECVVPVPVAPPVPFPAAPPPARVMLARAAEPVEAIVFCDPEPPPLSGPKTFLELGDHDCRWPLGDPLDPIFRYCGAIKSSRSYCAEHAKMGITVQVKKSSKPISSKPLLLGRAQMLGRVRR